jgi:hypothetical protein
LSSSNHSAREPTWLHAVPFSQLLLVRSKKCIKFTLGVSVYKARLHFVMISEN